MSERNPLSSIEKASDLYAFILGLYRFLDSVNIADLYKAYHCYLKEKEKKGADKNELRKLGELVDYLSFSHTIGFLPWKLSWLEMATSTEMTLPVFCLCTLTRIDDIIKSIAFEKDSFRIFEGPMSTDDVYFLYLKKPGKTFFSASFKEEKIYPGRTTVSYFGDSLNTQFQNFVVLKKDNLNDYVPLVYYYSERNYKKKMGSGSIKVAVVPFLESPWFRSHLNHDTQTFSVSYSQYHTTLINQAFLYYVAQAEENGANIIIFPEIAMSSQTGKLLEDALINAPKTFEHLKLCFFGSAWSDRSNISLLMSSSGTVLASQKKKVPYRLYHNDVYYREDIKYDNEVILIDIESVGRIAYLICADINDGKIQSLIKLMEVDFVFVSSYTKSTETMVKVADSHASLNAISTILCNARLAKDPEKPEKHSNAFCVVPKANNKKLSSKIISYITDDSGNHSSDIFYFDLQFNSCK